MIVENRKFFFLYNFVLLYKHCDLFFRLFLNEIYQTILFEIAPQIIRASLKKKISIVKFITRNLLLQIISNTIPSDKK